MNEDAINNYFNHLQESFKGVTASNLFNYDESNVTDDPESKQVITHHRRNRVEHKAHHSKSSISVIFAGSTDGTYLPPMVYKSKNISLEWVHGGPYNTVYSCTNLVLQMVCAIYSRIRRTNGLNRGQPWFSFFSLHIEGL